MKPKLITPKRSFRTLDIYSITRAQERGPKNNVPSALPTVQISLPFFDRHYFRRLVFAVAVVKLQPQYRTDEKFWNLEVRSTAVNQRVRLYIR